MIDPSQVTIRTTYGSAPSVDTFNGDIRLEQGANRLAVYDGNKIARTVVDIYGLTTSDPDGTQRVRTGIARSDGRSGSWVSDDGIDLRADGI